MNIDPKVVYHYLGKTTPEQDARLLKELDKVCDKHGKPWMSVYEFGENLLRTRDLDPIYVTLWEANLGRDRLQRLLIAYWGFYNLGTASWIADPNDEPTFWDRMEKAAGNKEYPRGSERRYYRGDNATDSVKFLRERGVEELFKPLRGNLTVEQVMAEVKSWKEFGPWIAFKVADMLERLDLADVSFSNGSMFLFDSPYKAAVELWKEESPKSPLPRKDVLASWAVNRVLRRLERTRTHEDEAKQGLAPPRYERAIGMPESETILCKGGSYKKGRYYVGKDTEELVHSLQRFRECSICRVLIHATSRAGLKG
jgi:hypothetical protein